MKMFSILTVVLAVLTMCTNAVAAIGFYDDDTDCVMSLTKNTTSTPGVYDIVLHIQNYGDTDAMMYRTSFWVIPWPALATSVLFQLSPSDVQSFDSTEAVGIGTVFNSNRTMTGRASVFGSLAEDEVNTALIMGVQFNIQPYVPTPGTASVIGLAGIVAMRRRR